MMESSKNKTLYHWLVKILSQFFTLYFNRFYFMLAIFMETDEYIYISTISVLSAFSKFMVKYPTMQYHWKWRESISQMCSETTTTSSCEALVVVCEL